MIFASSYYAKVTSHQQLHPPSHMNRTLSLPSKIPKTLQHTSSKLKKCIVSGANGPLS